MTKRMAMVVALVIAYEMSALTASAQANEGGRASTSAAAPRAGPELDQFKSWVGVWKCKGWTYASSSSLGPAHPNRLRFTTTRELDGFCYVTRGGEGKFKLVE